MASLRCLAPKLIFGLQERIIDIHAFTRAATLKAWAGLVEEKAVPLSRLQDLTTAAVDRLKDKAAAPRKTALTVCVPL